MSAEGDRLKVNAAISADKADVAKGVAKCVPRGYLQAVDVRVRDAAKGDAAVAGVKLQIDGPSSYKSSGETDSKGDIIFRVPPGAFTITATKDWHVPVPVTGNVTVAKYDFPVVPLVLEELRYYLHVDADRDGTMDDRHEGLNTVAPWRWGETNRGAVLLCNNDHDDAVALIVRSCDHEDNVVNQGNDGSHDVAPLQIRRVGPATAPPLAGNWTATLEILDGRENRIRIFSGTAPGAVALLGAMAAGAPVVNRAFLLHVAGIAATSYPTTTLGMEATTYPLSTFDGLIRLKLTVTGGGPAYYTAAEVRVAPWMMPNHLDDARRVYVADLGLDVPNAGDPTVLDGGNGTFRISLAGLVGGLPLEETSRNDRWMQDCMEIGYSVLPRDTGGVKRHRIEAAMQAYRDFGLWDLKDQAHSLLDADFGFHFPAASSAASAYTDDFLKGPGLTTAYAQAEDAVFRGLIEQAQAGLLAPVWSKVEADQAYQDFYVDGIAPTLPPEINDATRNTALAAEKALRDGGSVAAAKTLMIARARDALRAEGAPFTDATVVMAVPRLAANGAAQGVNKTTTFDSNGNLECTPPCRAGGKEYPWGRIYYGKGAVGNLFDAPTRTFLEAQRVQAPFALDTNWLEVGHVDEMMTFIPAPGAKFSNWRLVFASPRVAFGILDKVQPAAVVMPHRYMVRGTWVNVEMTAGQMRSGALDTAIENPVAKTKLTGQQLRDFNLNVIQPKINKVVTEVCTQVGIPEDQVIHIPVVFQPAGTMDKCSALTADMVNMLVVNGRCIIPKPFGPVDPVSGDDLFERAVTKALKDANPALHIDFLDDWYTYHVDEGEIHCGTNTNRHPADLSAWLGGPDAEWWRFRP